ncbi:alpha/beta fold hydrolase [uncultured Ruegeria sp.]|uniref:thioesterase II family protein n=1 Tax=uncultured Ruegeria sp. TaxID=259304 RepID=UPI00261A767D|nr:alpha/beta fold hydrolase [uncultured Ruegeria sp.]
MSVEIALNPHDATCAGLSGRLLCFPHAGGAGERFQDWISGFAPVLDVRSITLPGRGALLNHIPVESWSSLLAAVVTKILPLTDRPYALFGHSFGALLAYETARALGAKGRVPNLLVVAGRAPQMATHEVAISGLPRVAFLKELEAIDGTPADVLANANLMDRVLPAVRADFTLLERYDADDAENHPPLDCPILAVGSDNDPRVPFDTVLGWRHRTRLRFECRLFAGDHFFPFSNPDFADSLFDYVDGSLNEHSKDFHRAG